MEEASLDDLEKLLMELVFQVEQDTQKKDDLKQQIQICTDKSLEAKQQILNFHEKIKSCDEQILNLQTFCKSSSESSNVWKSTYDILTSQEKILQTELEHALKTTENEKKMYQDMLSQAKETFRCHQEKYMESPLAKNYYMKKQELDDLQNKILQYREQRKKAEKYILDNTGPKPFTSYEEWAIQLATLRKNTSEMNEQTARINLRTSDTLTQCRLLEQRLQYIKQRPCDISEHESSVVDKTLNVDKLMQFEKSMLTGNKELNSLVEKQKQEPLSHQSSQRNIKLFWQVNETGKCRNQRTSSSFPFVPLQNIEKTAQKSAELMDNVNESHAQSEHNLYKQTPLRPDHFQKQIQPKLISTERDLSNYTKENPSTYNDGDSQGIVPVIHEEMEMEASSGNVGLHKVPSYFSVTESPANLFFTNPDLRVKKIQDSTVPIIDMTESTENQEDEPVSDRWFFSPLPKSPDVTMVQSSLVQPTNLLKKDNTYSGVSTGRTSPLKGSAFWTMESDDETSFLFTSKAPQTSKKEEDDFAFLFGLDQKHNSSQSSFTFF